MPDIPLSANTIQSIKELMRKANLTDSDFTERFVLGSGSGGQKINKTASAVQLCHAASGIVVKMQQSRSRENNRWLARRALAEKILEQISDEKSKRQQLVEKIRRQKRRRSRKQKNKMLADKHHQSEKKNNRKIRHDE